MTLGLNAQVIASKTDHGAAMDGLILDPGSPVLHERRLAMQ
jgi:hypothetical protein